MHHPQAAQAVAVRDADEFGQGHAGFFGAQAVQIDLALNGPAAFAQFLRHVHPNAGAPEAQGVVGVEQTADVKAVAQGVAQNRFFVFFPLCGHRGWGRGADAGLVVGRHAFHRANRAHKQIGLGLALAGSSQASGLFGLRFFVGFGQFFLDLFQVLQGLDFHPPIVP